MLTNHVSIDIICFQLHSKGSTSMNSNIRIFLRKFLAALALQNKCSIPFSGDKFNNGIEAVEIYLQKKIETDLFDSLSEMFVKTPVQEVYSQISDMFMTYNGQFVKFSSVENPYWKKMTIEINKKDANHLLNDTEYLQIDRSIIEEASKMFCESAGI